MILFEEDWSLHPEAIAVSASQTANQSFIRIAQVYRAMGVKNHTFMLALHDTRLIGVDPFDPNLTIEQMGMITAECKINPWYFFREVARVPAIGDGDVIMFEANRGNIAAIWCFFNHAFTVLIQPRQTGKTFVADVLKVLLMNITCKNTVINLLTAGETLRKENIDKIKQITDELPAYLNMRNNSDSNNSETITVKANENKLYTHLPQAAEKAAYKLGRGFTSPIFFGDEVAYCLNISISLPAALASLGAAQERAKKQGTPYGTMLTTTAGKKDEPDGGYIFDTLQDGVMWDERYFDCKDQPSFEAMVCDATRDGDFILNLTFNHRQLGKTDDWLRERIRKARQKGEDAERDYLNKWTSGSQSHPLDASVLEIISKSALVTTFTDITAPYGYIIRWYIKESEVKHRLANGRFVMGMDPSDAGGGDDIGMVIVDVDTLEVIGAGHYNRTSTLTFSVWVADLLEQYPNITAIIERKSSGAYILDALLSMLPARGIDPFKRLYNTIVQNKGEHPERYKEICVPMNRRDSGIYERLKTAFGWATSASGATSRTELYSTTLRRAAELSGDRVRDQSLIAQVLGLITKNNRIDHANGKHDDLVIGWLLSQWLIGQGKHLSHYGIDNVMGKLFTKKDETPREQYDREKQQEIRRRILEIGDRLSSEIDENVSAKLEQELRLLDSQIILERGEVYSMDALLKQAKETQVGRRRAMAYRSDQSVYQQYRNSGFDHGVAARGIMSDRPLTASEMMRWH